MATRGPGNGDRGAGCDRDSHTRNPGLLAVQIEGEAVVLGVGDLLRMSLPPLRIIGADGASEVRVGCEQCVAKSRADQRLRSPGLTARCRGLSDCIASTQR